MIQTRKQKHDELISHIDSEINKYYLQYEKYLEHSKTKPYSKSMYTLAGKEFVYVCGLGFLRAMIAYELKYFYYGGRSALEVLTVDDINIIDYHKVQTSLLRSVVHYHDTFLECNSYSIEAKKHYVKHVKGVKNRDKQIKKAVTNHTSL